MTYLPALFLLLLPGFAGAVTLDFPGNGQLQSETIANLDSYPMPVGPWADGHVPVETTEGQLTRQAWRIGARGLTTLQIMAPLRDQLTAAGFEVLYRCDSRQCGGFDFRYATEILSPPDMYVDLGDFRYLAARHTLTGEVVSLVVSRSGQAGYVQITQVAPEGVQGLISNTQDPVLRGEVSAPDTDLPLDLGQELEQNGHLVLSDLTFEIGSAQLGQGPFASLQDLADYLATNSTRKVALVGHTDSQGSLDANISLSKRRAGSVLERLVSDYNVSRGQLAAEGMGFLAPVATNLTDEGRHANRRVEVIMTSIE